MHGERTPAWYWSRLELAIGIAVILVVAVQPFWASPFTDEAVQVGPILIWGRYVTALMALAPAVVGIIWMVRILRGPRDEPPPWRYRGH